MPARDPADRALMISLGAALFHLRLAARRFGRHLLVSALPEPGDRDLVALVRLGADEAPTLDERRLFSAIPRRRTNRFPFEDRHVSLPVAEEIRRAAPAEGAWALQVTADQQSALADLIAEGDRRLLADARIRHERAAWMHANRSSLRDGLPGFVSGAGDLASLLAPFVARHFDRGAMEAARDHELAELAPLLLVRGSAGDEPVDWLVTGQALARVLLTARDAGLQASFLNQAVEVDELRNRLRALLGHAGVPQLVLRIGYARRVRPTPRRPVGEVLAV